VRIFLGYVVVFLGAGLGGALRYGVSVTALRLLGIGFPYGTLTVNVIGSFVMGLLVGWFALRSIEENLIHLIYDIVSEHCNQDKDKLAPLTQFVKDLQSNDVLRAYTTTLMIFSITHQAKLILASATASKNASKLLSFRKTRTGKRIPFFICTDPYTGLLC
jgi:hypothetical protein